MNRVSPIKTVVCDTKACKEFYERSAFISCDLCNLNVCREECAPQGFNCTGCQSYCCFRCESDIQLKCKQCNKK